MNTERAYHDYHEAVAYIEGFSNTSLRDNLGKRKKELSFFIERTQCFLDLVGNPEKGFSYIHVTGTGGKGSVSSALQEVLVASGKKTGLFTSPYATTSIEEIRVDDKYIDPKKLVEIVEHLKPFVEKAGAGPYGAPSTFELFFAVALLYFKSQKCQWVVLEVGLGGRYDATNVIAKPKATVITNIDYDHTEILGKTLQRIAYDKAGIIKSGSHFFTSEQRPQLQRLFKKICAEKRAAAFYAVPRQKSYGDYNRELVKAISSFLGISSQHIEKGIARAKLPCRFEVMQERPLVILDGAHNRVKIRSTISNVERYARERKFDHLTIILAIANLKKDNKAIIAPLVPLASRIILTQVKSGDRRRISVHPSVLLPLVKKYKKRGALVEVVDDPKEALARTLKISKKDDMILATGSFFLAGELRKKWFSEEWVLKNRRSF